MKIEKIALNNPDIDDQPCGRFGMVGVLLTGQGGEQRALMAPVFVGANNIFTGDARVENLSAVAWVVASEWDWTAMEEETAAWESAAREIEGAEDFELPLALQPCGTLNEAIEHLLLELPEVRMAMKEALEAALTEIEEEAD